jgi:hypothetical protein
VGKLRISNGQVEGLDNKKLASHCAVGVHSFGNFVAAICHCRGQIPLHAES